MTKVSKKRYSKYKKGGECNRDCTIRPGCSGPRWYNPRTKECEFDFSGLRKMIGGSRSPHTGVSKDHSSFTKYLLYDKYPNLIPVNDKLVPIDINDENDKVKYSSFIEAAATATKKREAVEQLLKLNSAQTDKALEYINKTGGRRRRSKKKSKSKSRRRRRSRH